MKGSAKIEFSNKQSNCFATVSWPLASSSVRSSQGNLKIIKVVKENGETHFLSLSGSTSNPTNRGSESSTNVIKLNGRFANIIKLKDGEKVMFEEVDETVPVAVTSAKIACCSVDDWEILETNSEFVRTHLLSQLRVVYPGQEFPFWLSRSMVIHLKTDEINPNGPCGIISSNSDIIIPPISSSSTFILPNQLKSHKKLRVHLTTIPTHIPLLPTETLIFSNPFHAFTYKSHMQLTNQLDRKLEHVLVKVNWSTENMNEKDNNEGSLTGLDLNQALVKLFFLDCVESKVAKEFLPFVNIPCIYLHPQLLRGRKAVENSWVWVNAEESQDLPLPKSFVPKPLPVKPANPENSSVFIGFKSVLEECVSFVTASLALSTSQCHQHDFIGPEFGSLLIHGGQGSGKTSLAISIAQNLASVPYHVHWELINCAKLRGKKPENMEKEIIKVLQSSCLKQPSVIILDDFDILTTASSSTVERSEQEEFLLMKTNETLLETLMKFKSNRLSVICTASSKCLISSGYWQPRSGFHFFQKVVKIPAPSQAERLKIFMAYSNHYQRNAGSDNRNVATNLIDKRLALQNDDLIKEIEVALSTIHEQTGTPQFLVNVAKKWGAYLDSLSEDNNTRGHVPSSAVAPATATSPQINNINKSNEDVNEQMKAFNEILREEIRFSGDFSELKRGKTDEASSALNKISWDSIGGLVGVKEELKKILEWPIKFPQFFKNAPVRLPCGILFYGYPGTGKSLMGLAVQSIVNVKFIHVKGPELLSKYIGASEQAVQDVFARARESRPCILFFDEFDSLVPRRGHDSSGVTDRVVNQFLSEMDGIDGGLGQGVYLIAATSRPDLIDPAVLRPGRLDKHLFFNIPSQEERIEILKVLSTRINVQLEDDESDWNEIARLTEGFTGADLNSLMFSAQLAVVHKYLGEFNLDESTSPATKRDKYASSAAVPALSTQEIKVTKESVLSALKDFKPSVQGQELRKFQAIYQGFSTSKSGAKEVGTRLEEGGAAKNAWRMETGKRATLA